MTAQQIITSKERDEAASRWATVNGRTKGSFLNGWDACQKHNDKIINELKEKLRIAEQAALNNMRLAMGVK